MDFMKDRPGSTPESSPSPRNDSPRPASSGHDSRSPPPRVAFQAPSRSNSPRVKFSVTGSGKISRRMSSPPPPPERPPYFEHRVSFDLRSHEYAGAPSFGKSFTYEGYLPRNNARVYMCGTDNSDYANYALEYTIQHLMDDGDRLICVRAVQKDSVLGKALLADQQKHADEAQSVIEQIKRMLKENKGPAISVKIDTVIGSVGPLLIQTMVELHTPVCIIIGTKGFQTAKKQFGVAKSVGEYLYKYSPVPLIMVRPPETRSKKFDRRERIRPRERYSNPISSAMMDSEGRIIAPPAPDPSAADSKKTVDAMKAGHIDFSNARYQLHNRVSKKQTVRLTYQDIEGYVPDSADETEDLSSAPPSRTTSPVGHASGETGTQTDVDTLDADEVAARGSQDTIEDDDFGETLTKAASSGSILQSGWSRQPRKQFHEMPNYDERVVKLMDKLDKDQDHANAATTGRRRSSVKWKDQINAPIGENRAGQAESGYDEVAGPKGAEGGETNSKYPDGIILSEGDEYEVSVEEKSLTETKVNFADTKPKGMEIKKPERLDAKAKNSATETSGMDEPATIDAKEPMATSVEVHPPPNAEMNQTNRERKFSLTNDSQCAASPVISRQEDADPALQVESREPMEPKRHETETAVENPSEVEAKGSDHDEEKVAESATAVPVDHAVSCSRE